VSFYLRFFAQLVLSARRWTQLHPAPIES
jgi:hypothetical protein